MVVLLMVVVVTSLSLLLSLLFDRTARLAHHQVFRFIALSKNLTAAAAVVAAIVNYFIVIIVFKAPQR